MGIADVFKVNEFKIENEKLKKQLTDLQNAFTPEMRDAQQIKEIIQSLEQTKESLKQEIDTQRNTLNAINTQITTKQNDLVILDEELLLQEFGLYKPVYDFASSVDYKIRLESIRNKQKEMIKNGTAAVGNMNWSINNNTAKGKKLVQDMLKLLLRAFNNECDDIVSKVKYNNFDQCLKRMTSSCDSISKLGKMMQITITQWYYDAKVEELRLSYEYQQKKQEEKEIQKAIREQMKEEAKLQREIEEARKIAEKERKHYDIALEKTITQFKVCSNDVEKQILLEKIEELKSRLNIIEKNIQEIDYRAANQKAGYVYVISNIGAFGENVYKIGMTRRLEPMDRIDELSSASVPFNFDVHAMIFSNDAPKLEAALHNAFANKKLNLINTRREFFQVTLEEIEQVVKENHDKSVEFVKYPDAQQYRESLKLKQQNPTQLIQPVLVNSPPPKQSNNSNQAITKTFTKPYTVDLIRHTPYKKRTLPNKHLNNKL